MADRQYELVYILPPDTTEQQVTELHGQIEAVVSRMSGTFDKTENWGRKRLAYEIGPHKEGVYLLDVINGQIRAIPGVRSTDAFVYLRLEKQTYSWGT